MHVVSYLYIVLFNDVCCIIFVYCISCLIMYDVLYFYIVLFNDACCIIYVYCVV